MHNILIAGGSGLLGKELTKILITKGYQVGILSRSKREAKQNVRYFQWDPDSGHVETEAIQWMDYLINLAGEGIADKRWTAKRKREITESRTTSNRVLLHACHAENKLPKAYLSAGGMNFYGDSGDEVLTERHPKGQKGFLPDSCEAWESSVAEWSKAGVRTVQYRISVILSLDGGALPKMGMTLPLGIVPYFGDGQQWMSWIHIEDMARLFAFALEKEDMQGIYNAASPHPARNKDFCRALLKAVNKKGWTPPVPAFLLQIALGDMSETVLSSVRLSVDLLQENGYQWKYPELTGALSSLLQSKQ